MRLRELQAQLAKTTFSPQGRIQSQVEALQQKERAIVQMKSQGEQRIDVFMVRKNSGVGLSVHELQSRNGISAKLLESLITLTTQKDLIDKQTGPEQDGVKEGQKELWHHGSGGVQAFSSSTALGLPDASTFHIQPHILGVGWLLWSPPSGDR